MRRYLTTLALPINTFFWTRIKNTLIRKKSYNNWSFESESQLKYLQLQYWNLILRITEEYRYPE